MADLNEAISIDAEQVIGALEHQVGQQAGMIARLESVITQLQARLQVVAAKVPEEGLSADD